MAWPESINIKGHVTTEVNRVIDSIKTKISNLETNIKTAITNSETNIKTNSNNNKNTIISKVDAVKTDTDSIKTKVTSLDTVVSNMKTSFQNGFEKIASELRADGVTDAKWTDGPDKIKSNIDKIWRDRYNAGKEYVENKIATSSSIIQYVNHGTMSIQSKYTYAYDPSAEDPKTGCELVDNVKTIEITVPEVSKRKSKVLIISPYTDMESYKHSYNYQNDNKFNDVYIGSTVTPILEYKINHEDSGTGSCDGAYRDEITKYDIIELSSSNSWKLVLGKTFVASESYRGSTIMHNTYIHIYVQKDSGGNMTKIVFEGHYPELIDYRKDYSYYYGNSSVKLNLSNVGIRYI